MTDFPWIPLLPLLNANGTLCRGILGFEVATQGDGPYSELDFDIFLEESGIKIFDVATGGLSANTVIFGREGWDVATVDDLRSEASGRPLRVFSQEMVVASLAAGVDVFDELNGEIGGFADGHPALERFYRAEPDYQEVAIPETPLYVPSSGGIVTVDFDAGDWPAHGVLNKMGYKVGRTGLNPAARRNILGTVLSVNLIAKSSSADCYVAEWGAPNTHHRLQKIVNSIATFARTAKRQTSRDMSQAIQDWENDLEWLRATYRQT